MIEMNFVFRVDASIRIGAGHAMRCLAVAESLKKRAKTIVFICRESDADLITYIQEQGYQVVALSAQESKRDSSQTMVEEAVLRTLKRLKPCSCIVDHYEIDWRWESVVKPFCKQLCVIDDLANRKHCCDLLLDSELGGKKAKYQTLLPATCKLLLGASYALLKAPFRKLSPLVQKKIEAFQKVKVILVNVGAYDQKNIIPTIVQVILTLNLNLKIRVVVASKTPNIQAIKSLAHSHNNVTLCCDVEDMASEIIKSDFAIGSVGGGAYERAVLGVTGCIIPTASNQEFIAKEFEKQGLAKLVLLDEHFVACLTETLTYLMDSPKLLKKMAKNGLQEVNVHGAEAFATKLLECSQ